ncbi:hypothetical protein [Actinophytocola sp.]|uniref:hypothetical protein n=1 Tax=Actinophytocola sp. TaxID=1872138 RepID=UPI002D3D8E27|nr:hypothetical protein [Actinophytocola sp.]HYQ67107.1 hypothetical protein [Actinophytocola sp.]
MTSPDDELTAALTHTLRHHAEEAPSTDGLPEKAMAIATRRRRRRVNASIAAIVVLVVGVPVAVMRTVDGGNGTPSGPAVAAKADQADPGRRWESYHGVEVQVPEDWGYGIFQLTPCLSQETREKWHAQPGVVGRPGPIAAVGCTIDWRPSDFWENWLVFADNGKVGKDEFEGGWVKETRRINGVFVSVFSKDAALRKSIFDTARPVGGIDANGCPSDHPVTADPGSYRPDAGGGLPPTDTVTSISVCRYALKSLSTPSLLSSGRITGRTAEEAVDALRSAPEGVGPDSENGTPGRFGEEISVVRLNTAGGTHEVVVRYGNEVGNGFDDGTTKRRLTADTLRLLFSKGNHPGTFNVSVADLMPRQ